MVSPLIQSQPPEIRNTARFCNSSIEPTRPIGFLAIVRAPGASLGLRRLLMPSVGISPGAMVLRRMPYLPHSIASDIVMAWIADLLIALGTETEKARGHRLAEAGAATGHEDAPPGEKLIVEHRFHPKELLLIGRLTKSAQRRSVKRQPRKTAEENSHGATRLDIDLGRHRRRPTGAGGQDERARCRDVRCAGGRD